MNTGLSPIAPLARRARTTWRRLLPPLVVIAALLIALLLYLTRSQLVPHTVERPPTAVRFVEVQPRDMRLTVISQGEVQPRTESELIPEISGTVVWLSPALASGGRFAAGEVLLRIDERDYRNALGSAEAALVRAQAEAEYAHFENERLSKLQARDLTSRSQAENALRAMRVTASAREEAKVAVERARLDLQRCEIRAPFSGRVRSKRIDIGQMASRGNSVATLYAADYVEIRLPIADRQLAFLDPQLMLSGTVSSAQAAPVRLRAHFGGRELTWDGRIVRTEGEIDARSRMVHVVARVENPDGDGQLPLPVGLFVDAEIRGPLASGVIELPRTAMRDGNRVLVIDAGQRLRFRQVEVLRIEHDLVLIRSGLARGERVCVSSLQLVVDGMPVTALRDDAEAQE
ncbi:MAG: efflux RND transporter periplasmic adaptor subunit [Gammaproteobacteria bacterium]|jgi:RND family efflux transporter MFP subunit|nr:efflux RND transporter periplasmic adaptor subunit [Gammaproteobacteria bacterium]MBP6050904.1 efflux RND transporter periplasmic adaptor subunit [Pseudomonadales bacterium]MBK6582411.1 efflux RND transporter periplasmic adaptor subunit [Gammaproteobacteria bacterium]MBK7521318.1 efflux RND transporter periplasmic adaptor subunit [Gammaproteobacteria bacterium]MBK7729094.1 efflux RND transporter periplasmic adaptor subunit [Gammaproteobacteria bacterium]